MNLYQNLYYGNASEKKKHILKERLMNDPKTHHVILICLATGACNQLEILSAASYHKQIAQKGEPLIIGLAESSIAARSVVLEITRDVYEQTSSAEIKKYFLERG